MTICPGDILTAWTVDGLSSEAGGRAAERLNRIHLAVARGTPHPPGSFDDVDDPVCPPVLPATFGDRLETSLGVPGASEDMKTAFRARRPLPDYRTPLPERLGRG
uniref:hypothetical protein n=1 Tax=Streptomyces asoensis TaxID=249586 RepID=UPI00209C4DCD|nr:hypothetical protein [Streptomyces asoensis]